jgi:hypothetical protein
MAQIAVAPLFLKDVLFSVGTDSYEKHVSSVTFTPSTSPQTWKGLNPESTFTNVGTATWTVDIEFAQDWATTSSLSAYLFDNQGQTKTVVFEPVNGGQGFTASIIIVAGAIGGAVDGYGTATVSLPLQGQPTRAV